MFQHLIPFLSAVSSSSLSLVLQLMVHLWPQWWPEFLFRWHVPRYWCLRVFSCPRRTRCSPLCPCTRRTPAKRSLPIGHSLSRSGRKHRSHHGWLLFTLTVKLFSTSVKYILQIYLTDANTTVVFQRSFQQDYRILFTRNNGGLWLLWDIRKIANKNP